MKYIRFDEKIIEVPSNVIFWMQYTGRTDELAFCVNMAILKPEDFNTIYNHKFMDSILLRERYKTSEEAYQRMEAMLLELNK